MGSGDITSWLHRLSDGDDAALDEVVRRLYADVHEVARARLRRERDGHTLTPTALVNEVYLRLRDQQHIDAESRTRFLAVSATTMRRVLVDYARARKRLKRGGGQSVQSLEGETPVLTNEAADEVIALDDAFTRLQSFHPRGADVVEQRFFAGLTFAEIAELRGVSAKTIQRDWTAASAWLRKEVRRVLAS